MKVYIITKALPMQEEIYVAVKSSMKAAEKFIRKDYPGARKDDLIQDYIDFRCIGPFDWSDRLSGKTREFSMYIREEELN